MSKVAMIFEILQNGVLFYRDYTASELTSDLFEDLAEDTVSDKKRILCDFRCFASDMVSAVSICKKTNNISERV